MNRPACMTEPEWSAWREANERLLPIYRSDSPCRDCTVTFHLEMLRAGRCDGAPVLRWCRKPAVVTA